MLGRVNYGVGLFLVWLMFVCAVQFGGLAIGVWQWLHP